ncbi:putative heat shock protein 70 (Chaperone protein dnaK) [Chlamydiales bacterium STE3]|nr:putative heat shock protein 70 (Chaperone protein dnaK) [Chlamydiales bacterium STE3]
MATKIIGIDLGTTNCTLAYTEADNSTPIEQFAIPQLTKNGFEEQFSLPSFIYFPLSDELKAEQKERGWAACSNGFVGAFARDRGEEVPHRLISSAKSWLSHSAINRREKILPLHEEFQDLRISPVDAIAKALKHLKEAWDFKNPHEPFQQQQILITVPASFDPSARQLVLEAAKNVEYPEIALLEEPQAAFYSWLDLHKEEWRKLLKVGDQILVVDIGGGTTDFSIIEVCEESGSLLLNRKAVGSHLLLGGDNFDLALAYYVKQKFEDAGQSISDWQFSFLNHFCRKAKEQFLSEDPPETMEVVVQGRGSKLIGNSIKTTLHIVEVLQIVIESFAPIVAPSEHAKPERQHGIQQIGLPYVKDPRLSAQLARFLTLSEAPEASMEKFVLPNYVLFNGGTLKAEKLRNRILALLNHWATQLNQPEVKELPGADLDFAVSRGAAAYGLARAGHTMRIKGGASHSYFIGIEDAMPAVPGIEPPLKAYCIVPFGMEEGTECELPKHHFTLLLGETATFRFFSLPAKTLSTGVEVEVGTVVKNWRQELTELHSIETRLEQNNLEHPLVKVRLKSKITELGILELYCFDEDNQTWKLEFDTRGQSK